MTYEDRVDESARRTALWGIYWPGHPDSGADGPIEESLRDEPERWRLVCVEEDPAADYSYDDLALMVRDDDVHALVQTSGCSCPSPSETWGVVADGTLADMRAKIERERTEWRDGDLRGPWIAMDVFVATLETAS